MDVRCPSRIHFTVNDDGLIEVKCRSKHCGAGAGTVVIHQFDPMTRELVKTNRYQEPPKVASLTKEAACR